MAERDPSLHILQHALGLDDYGQGTPYRNHYVIGTMGDGWALCMAHVEAGRMERHGPSEFFGGGNGYSFHVTETGREYVRVHSPPAAKLKILDFTISRPVSYRFVFDEGGWNGWAILTINEDTGEVHIQSDYGNYQHRWTPAHTGEDGPQAMHNFFARASTGYLVDKFSYGQQPDLKDVFDEADTKATIRERILRERRDKWLCASRARWLWAQLDVWCDCECELALIDNALNDYLGNEPWSHIKTKASARRVFLLDTLVPFLQTWLLENVIDKGGQDA